MDPNKPILSILIPSLNSRKRTLEGLSHVLNRQIGKIEEGYRKVEIIKDIDNGEKTTGEKRNNLLLKANGLYSVFIDDDDHIGDNYIKLVLEASKENKDCITYNGFMTTNSSDRVDWVIELNERYEGRQIDGKLVYFRFPNHIVPIKTEIAKQARFPNKTVGEDIVWACQLNGHKHKPGAGVIYNNHKSLIKTSTHINLPMYHYDYRTNKNTIR